MSGYAFILHILIKISIHVFFPLINDLLFLP